MEEKGGGGARGGDGGEGGGCEGRDWALCAPGQRSWTGLGWGVGGEWDGEWERGGDQETCGIGWI